MLYIRRTITLLSVFAFFVTGLPLSAANAAIYAAPPDDAAVSFDHSTIVVSPTQIVADGIQSATVTVTIRNWKDQPLAGRAVILNSTLPGNVVVAPTQTTSDAQGAARFTVKSTHVGFVAFYTTVDGVLLLQQPSLILMETPSCPFANLGLFKLPDDGNPGTQEDSAVYYYGKDCKRYAFSNANVFFSWYVDFSNVRTIPLEQMASISLGKNVTFRPGMLIKFPSVPKVYAVSKGGVLRWITTEQIASTLYGSSWNTHVQDVSESFYTDYAFGSNIETAGQFIPQNEKDNTPTIADDIR